MKKFKELTKTEMQKVKGGGGASDFFSGVGNVLYYGITRLNSGYQAGRIIEKNKQKGAF